MILNFKQGVLTNNNIEEVKEYYNRKKKQIEKSLERKCSCRNNEDCILKLKDLKVSYKVRGKNEQDIAEIFITCPYKNEASDRLDVL